MTKINKEEIERVARKISKIEWQKVGQWKTPFLMDYIILEATKLEGFRSRDFLFWFKNFYIINGEFIFSKDVERIRKYFERNYQRKGYAFLKRYSQKMLQASKETLDWASKLPDYSKVKQLTVKELKDLFNVFVYKMSHSAIAWGYIIFGIDNFLSQNIYKKLENHISKRSIKLSIDEILARLTPPKRVAFMIKEREDLLAVASMINEDKRLRKIFIESRLRELEKNLEKKIGKRLANKIKNHYFLYAWMNSLNWNTPLYGLGYYLKRIKKLIQNNPRKQLFEARKERRQKEKRIKDTIKEIKLPKNILLEVDLIRNFIDAKMLNWDTVSIGGYKMRPVLEEIASLIGLTYDDVLSCAPQEINNALEKNIVPPVYYLKERRTKRALVRLGQTVYCYAGEEVDILKRYLAKKEKFGARLLKGNIGFSGKIRGRVNIILNVDAINKMKKGDILVCPMTNPDYMPAVSKALGIVTNEGGILCHAAIVSRELNIPCIIGTKIATKVLKDGQLVEVDANKGRVRILGR